MGSPTRESLLYLVITTKSSDRVEEEGEDENGGLQIRLCRGLICVIVTCTLDSHFSTSQDRDGT